MNDVFVPMFGVDAPTLLITRCVLRCILRSKRRHVTAPDELTQHEMDRRRALRTGAAAVAGAGVLWAAPAILSADAASAATAPPGPPP